MPERLARFCVAGSSIALSKLYGDSWLSLTLTYLQKSSPNGSGGAMCLADRVGVCLHTAQPYSSGAVFVVQMSLLELTTLLLGTKKVRMTARVRSVMD